MYYVYFLSLLFYYHFLAVYYVQSLPRSTEPAAVEVIINILSAVFVSLNALYSRRLKALYVLEFLPVLRIPVCLQSLFGNIERSIVFII